MRLGLFGGGFNPVHVGHLRLAVELAEALDLRRVELVPTFEHPLKSRAGMLPYDLRLAMLAAAVEGVPRLAVSDVESHLPPPSYTYRTLAHLRAVRPEAELFFCMSVSDLLDLPKWHRGDELPAHLAVATRLGLGLAAAESFVPGFWPRASRLDAPANALAAWALPGGRNLTLVDVTRMDLCATDIRHRFLDGRCILGLVPGGAQAVLEARRAEVEAVWRTHPQAHVSGCASQ